MYCVDIVVSNNEFELMVYWMCIFFRSKCISVWFVERERVYIWFCSILLIVLILFVEGDIFIYWWCRENFC